MLDVTLCWHEIKEYDTKTMKNVSNIFDNEWLCRYPRPHYVIFDNGTEFGSIFRELLESYSIVPKQTMIRTPKANAYIERNHHVIANALRAMDLESKPLDPFKVNGIFQCVAWSMRSTHHTSLAANPGQLTFRRDMIIRSTYIANWHHLRQTSLNNTTRNNQRENRRRLPHQYQVEQIVCISSNDITRKLSSRHEPFLITDVHSNGTITVHRSATDRERINIRRVHPIF